MRVSKMRSTLFLPNVNERAPRDLYFPVELLNCRNLSSVLCEPCA
jgi:hypothetical protein